MDSSKITLLHITSSLQMGGAERVLYDIVTGLEPSKYRQVVLYFHEGPYAQLLRDKGIPLIKIHGLWFRYDPIFFIRLFATIRRVKPDKMHTLLWMANVTGRLIGKLLKIPTFSVMHNNVTQDGWVRSAIDHFTLFRSAQLIAVSSEVRDSLCARHTWLPATQISIITNGVAAELFTDAAVTVRDRRITFGFAPDEFVVGSVGRFVPIKQYDLLLSSFAHVYAQRPNVRLLLVGTGPEEQKLRSLARELGIGPVVTFIISKPAINYYGLFDCFVMSSAQEGISIALLEAMSSRLACVVTNSKSPDHMVLTHGYDGLVLASNDENSLSRGIMRMVDDSALRQSLGQAALQTVTDQFQKKQMISRYDQLFSTMGINQK